MTTQPCRRSEVIPAYDPLQRAFHQAFDHELRAIVVDLKIPSDSKILDLPCGDGFFTRRVAKTLSSPGKILGVDSNEAYLEIANRLTEQKNIRYEKGDAYELMYEDESFDHIICMMSLITLKEPTRALREMKRVLKMSGSIAILESDQLHQVLLNWPVEFEISILQSIFQKVGGRQSQSRNVGGLLRKCGFDRIERKTYSTDRQVPFSDSVRHYLTLYLDDLRNLIFHLLDEKEQKLFNKLADPNHPDSIFSRPGSEMAHLLTLHRAWK